jgi:hypothetical protein
VAFRQEGNGEGKTLIDFVGRANYVLICPHDAATLPPNIAAIINQALLDWLKQHPAVRVRAALPITQDGQTTALHLWYDGPDMGG